MRHLRTKKPDQRGWTPIVSLFLALALVVAACSSGGSGDTTTTASDDGGAGDDTTTVPSGGDDDAFPSQDVRVIIPADPGGSADQVMRLMQPYWEERLGVSMIIDNRPGAGLTVGTQMAANQPADCYTVVWQLFPNIVMGYLTQDGLDYTYDDFYPLGNATYEPTIMRVRNDAPWETLQDLVDDALSRPEEIPGAVSSLNNFQYVAGLYLEEATGADFNMVPFGGGPSRTALVAEEVDFVIAGVFNSLTIDEESRVLAVFDEENRWPALTDDAPTASEAIGVEMEPTPHTLFPLVHRECKDGYPERFEVLETTFLETLQSDEFQAVVEEQGTADRYQVVTADETHEYIEERIPMVEEVIAENEELQP